MQQKNLSCLRFEKNEIHSFLIFVLLFLFLHLTGCSDKKGFELNDYYSNGVLKSEREKFLIKTINKTVKSNFSNTLTDSTEKYYQSAFWAMELIHYKNEFTDSVINSCFDKLNERSEEFQRSFLEVVYTLYQDKFTFEVEAFAKGTNNPKLFAMCVDYLKNSGSNLNKMFSKFLKTNPELIDHPIIDMLEYSLSNEMVSIPPIQELFHHNFNDKLVIFSIQRSNRNYPGLVVIKKPNGEFLLDESVEIYSVPQLARAITNLPGYITNGNTPEGILSIQGIDVSKNVFIGPSPNLQLVLPYEVNPKTYYHNEVTDTVWNKDLYTRLLPDSWKNYLPIFEAYFAGKAGRNEIIAHGTTIDPEFYKNKSYYPFTPSLGCLTTKEIWSGTNGKISKSDQLKFMNAFIKAGSEKGFFIVVNIDDKQSPVTFDEIKSFINNTEK